MRWRWSKLRESGSHANNLADRCANPEWPAPRQRRVRRTSSRPCPSLEFRPLNGPGKVPFRWTVVVKWLLDCG
jgi:hypothetical protein